MFKALEMRYYRAMCKDELDATLSTGKFSFNKRHKWLTNHFGFMYKRVLSNEFNPVGNYDWVVALEIAEPVLQINKKEFMLKEHIPFEIAWVKSKEDVLNDVPDIHQNI